MKLLYCIVCKDMFKLQIDIVRKCKCGRSTGRYKKDGNYAEVNGKGICVAINNSSLADAIENMAQVNTNVVRKSVAKDRVVIERYNKTIPKEWFVECWIRPNEGKRNKTTSVNRRLKAK